jgi:hypothetical protein
MFLSTSGCGRNPRPGDNGFDLVCIRDESEKYRGRSRGDNAIKTANIAQKNPAKPR